MASQAELDDDDLPLSLRLLPPTAGERRRLRRENHSLEQIQPAKRSRRRPREKPRWELQNIPDEELTLWELCMRNRRELTEEEKRAKRMKLNEQKLGEEKALAERQNLLNELGANANNDVLDLFNTATTASTNQPGPSAQQGSSMEIDLFATGEGGGSNLYGGGADDPFALETNYEFTTIEGSETRHSLPAFAGAYKKTKAAQWSTADTNEFYKVLARHGCDPMLIQVSMPKFSIQQIVTKIQREMKSNAQIFEALVSRKSITG